MTTFSKHTGNRPLLPTEIEDILKNFHYPDDFVTEGWTKVNDEWIECGATPGVKILNQNSKITHAPGTYLTMHDVAGKLNDLEAEIERLKSRASESNDPPDHGLQLLREGIRFDFR